MLAIDTNPSGPSYQATTGIQVFDPEKGDTAPTNGTLAVNGTRLYLTSRGDDTLRVIETDPTPTAYGHTVTIPLGITPPGSPSAPMTPWPT